MGFGIGKFLHNATRAAGKFVNHVQHQVQHTINQAAHTIEHAAVRAGSAAAVGIGKAVRTTGRAVGHVGIGHFNVGNISRTLTHVKVPVIGLNLDQASQELAKGISKISHLPVLGPIIAVTTGLPIVNAINSAARGQRIDRAALGALNETVKDYKEIGPYAASVVAFVPGIGPGVGAGINAGLALAEGKPWSDIAIEAAKGAIPGGAIAQAAFDAAQAAARGKPLDQIGIAALPIPDQAKQGVTAALALTRDIASGKPVDQALLARVNDALNIAGIQGTAAQAISSGAQLARDLAAGKDVRTALLARADDAIKLAGPEVAKALQIGTAIGTARKIQDTVMKQIGKPEALDALKKLGTSVIAKSIPLQHGLSQISHDPIFNQGAAIASGLMGGHNVTESMIQGARNALTAEGKKGFDTATAYFIGKHTVPGKPIRHTGRTGAIHPAQSFAYYATHGLEGAGDQQKQEIVGKLASASHETRAGATDAINAVGALRKANAFNDMTLPQKLKLFWEGRG